MVSDSQLVAPRKDWLNVDAPVGDVMVLLEIEDSCHSLLVRESSDVIRRLGLRAHVESVEDAVVVHACIRFYQIWEMIRKDPEMNQR